MEIRETLSQHIAALPEHLVKDVLLRWVETSDFSPVALDKALVEQQQSLETPLHGSDHQGNNVHYGELDDDLNFVPLTEEQMVAKSKAVLADYKQTGHAVPHDQMKTWAASLGSAHELQCPH